MGAMIALTSVPLWLCFVLFLCLGLPGFIVALCRSVTLRPGASAWSSELCVYRDSFTYCFLAISPLFEMYLFLLIISWMGLFISTYHVFALPNKKLSTSHQIHTAFPIHCGFHRYLKVSLKLSLHCCLWPQPGIGLSLLVRAFPALLTWRTSLLNDSVFLLLQLVQCPLGPQKTTHKKFCCRKFYFFDEKG